MCNSTRYDENYYKKACEGDKYSIDSLSPRLRHFEDWIAPQLEGTVFDIGFGRGELTIRSARLLQVNCVVAFDFSIDASIILINNLKQESELTRSKIWIVSADIDFILPHLSLRCQHVILFDVIEHLYPDQIKRLLRRLVSRLDLGGKVYISTPISKECTDAEHVWLARNPDDLKKLCPAGLSFLDRGWAGIGEDHLFELERV